MERIGVRISGRRTPLLVNRFYEEAQVEATGGTHTRSRDRLSPEDDAANRLYRSPDGTIYFEAENLRQSIIIAAGRHKIGRRSAAVDVAAALLIEPFAMPLTGIGALTSGQWSSPPRADACSVVAQSSSNGPSRRRWLSIHGLWTRNCSDELWMTRVTTLAWVILGQPRRAHTAGSKSTVGNLSRTSLR